MVQGVPVVRKVVSGIKKWSQLVEWSQAKRQRRSAGPSMDEKGDCGRSVVAGKKGTVFCLRVVLKEAPCLPKAPQPMRCADEHGRNALMSSLMCPSQTNHLCLS